MNVDAQKIKQEIESLGHMLVVFEPSTYVENKIERKKLQETLDKSKVSLRGWSFPHIPTQDKEDASSVRPYIEKNFIEFYTSWSGIMEISRFYQSGQFVSKFVLREDTVGDLQHMKIPKGKYMDFLSLIYKLTEVCLFVRNLFQNTDFEGGTIKIDINQTRNRELEPIFSRNIFGFNGWYICRASNINLSINIEREQILNDPLEIARKLIMEVFDHFNWKDYQENMIKTHQENLVNRRI